MKISVVVPAFRASDTIAETLASLFAKRLPDHWQLETIVVDDGSPDGTELASAVAVYPSVTLIHLPENRGKCKAMNAGIIRSTGDAVVLLDADDTLVPDWPQVMEQVVAEWPDDCAICFTACRTPDGRSTVSYPRYSGPLSFRDMLADRYSGEYLPMFRGEVLRAAGGYWDTGDRWECLILTYLDFGRKYPIWISPRVLRIYHDNRPGSVSDQAKRRSGAAGVSRCYGHVFDAFGEDYRRLAPIAYRKRRLRQAVFSAIAGEGRSLTLWREAAHWSVPLESIAALLIVASRGRIGLGLVELCKRLGILRRYG